MKLKVAFGFFFALILTSSIAWAGGKIPTLIGKWSVESSGGMMLNAEKEGKETHWTAGQKVLKGLMDITTQEDRFVSGTYTSARGSEKFIAMITPDGKYMYASDTDGFFDCKITNKDTLEIVYRHVKATDSVVAIGIAKRQK
ncbi:hypothetical protein [Solidesulfovibrio magneticus]|uniref:Lipocalin-like domain-containing protein n=1 Tax=Solidesulfovibrio magneticus (strain ATCC 700980 / DSM 13731 / RS-1) TaxID=573370 RepID=C4XTW7_SOLM1|nr:hypothetical protein [Solidesulfovibrio magneticus]BAH73632.1 hypothetical protein DMR_01410 [Solidesulfovibrio magneticus RS-1]